MELDFFPVRFERSGAILLNVSPARAFEMFTPLGERAWAQGWDPMFLHPRDGRACEGSVFITRAGGQETIWTTITHEPPLRVAYCRVTPGVHAIIVKVQLLELADGTTQAGVSYDITALSQEGNGAVAKMADGFAGWMDEWQTSINRALSAQGE